MKKVNQIKRKYFIVTAMSILVMLCIVGIAYRGDTGDDEIVEHEEISVTPEEESVGGNDEISEKTDESNESTERIKDDTERVILDGETVDKIGQCLEEQVPEICDWGIFVEERSDGQAYLYERYDGEIEEVYKNGEGSEYLGKYYTVYVGEMWEDHSVNWAWFYVSVDFNEVLWKDALRLKESEFETYTLEEWRDSPYYPQLDEEK